MSAATQSAVDGLRQQVAKAFAPEEEPDENVAEPAPAISSAPLQGPALIDTNGPLRQGLVAMALVALALLVAGAFVPLAKAVVLDGRVRLEGTRHAVQHETGGTVERVLVAEGDQVKAGDPLIILSDAPTRHDLKNLRYQTMQQALTIGRLEAEANGARALVRDDYSRWRDEADFEAAFSLAEATLRSRARAHQSELFTLSLSAAKAARQRSATLRRLQAFEARYDLSRRDVRRLRTGFRDGVVARNAVSSAERTMLTMQSEAEEMRARREDAAKAGDEIDAEIAAARARFAERTSSELTQAATAFSDLSQRLAEAQRRQAANRIVAPVAGRVQNLQAAAIGAVVRPGEPLAEVVPGDGRLRLEVRVPPQNIGDVERGLPADVRISSFSGRDAPTFQGEVTSVSSDIYFKPVDRTPPAYLAIVELADDPLVARLQPGMEASVTVRSGSQSLLGYLLTPIRTSLRTALTES